MALAGDACRPGLVVNKALVEFLGRPAEELSRIALLDLIHPDRHPAQLAQHRALLEERCESYSAQGQYRHSDGSPRWANVRVSRVATQTPTVTSVVAYFSDLTGIRLAEDRFRAQSDLARLGEMAAIVAHEVKNPLAGIGGALQVIRDRMPVRAPERLIVNEIQERLQGINDTVENLLAFARPVTPQRAPVPVGQLLRDAALLLVHKSGFNDVQVDLPANDALVDADPELMRDLFLYLYENSAQAMGGTGQIHVTVYETGTWCRVEVADTGPGVAPELRDRILEPFFSTKSRGIGLGLALAQRTIEAHDGTLELSEADGGGLRVAVSLPLAQSVLANPAREYSPTG
jgi:PAS domain S-box-containing protein